MCAWSEPHLDAEVQAARHRKVSIVDSRRARAADRRGVAVHDWVEAGIVRPQPQIGRRHEEASAVEESIREAIAQRHVAESNPVDVLLRDVTLSYGLPDRFLNGA